MEVSNSKFSYSEKAKPFPHFFNASSAISVLVRGNPPPMVVGFPGLKLIQFPLPPLAEQTEIVRKVERLLAKVTELEKQIAERKEYTKQLLSGILKGAFEEK
ncbi:MAG: restriction endonuclease subunit S [Treponema sp.]|nr:restriction endonuclease subunit S [Treponema sp.]